MIICRKARSSRQTLNDLDAYLRQTGNEPAEWLAREVQKWGEFSYSDLEAAILDGHLNDLIDWQARYAEVVNGTLAPMWAMAMAAAAKKATKEKVILDDSDVFVKAWIQTHGGELITRLSEESRRAVAAIILRGQAERILPRDMAKQIRPLIGLTEIQAQANVNYREKIYRSYLEGGASSTVAAARADKAAVKYASQQHRFRAETIVHTELAFAYNRGAHMGVSQAVSDRLMGRCEMVWSTAGTNRVCGRCLALKDTVVGHTDESGVTLPPLHPRCRCAIMYREIEKPKPPAPPKDFKTEIAALKEQLKNQRIQGATASEIETTVKAAGKLVADRIKAIKIYDLPPEERIDLQLLEKTYYDFRKSIYYRNVSREVQNELKSIAEKMREELEIFYDKVADEIPKTQRERAEQLKAILSEIRPMGATKQQLKAQFGSSRSKVRKIFDTALNYYPSDWVETSVNFGVLKTKKPENRRAYYSPWELVITVMPDDQKKIGTAVHELGHRMEHVIKEILDSETQFYSRRTAGEALKKIRDITGNLGYADNEVARKDKFLSVYMGKDYGGRAYELVSMGFQWAYTDPAILLQDEDMAEWILGLLALI